MGTFRWHPTEFILAAAEEARAVTDQIGFLATAVGDHPEVETILEEVCRMGFRASVSSIRIPAVDRGSAGGPPRVGRSLHHAGAGDRGRCVAGQDGEAG